MTDAIAPAPGVYLVHVQHGPNGTIVQRMTPAPEAQELFDLRREVAEHRRERRVRNFERVASLLADRMGLAPKEARLAALLYINAPMSADRQTIGAALYGTRDVGGPADADRSLRQLAGRLRRKFGERSILPDGFQGYRMSEGAVERCRAAVEGAAET